MPMKAATYKTMLQTAQQGVAAGFAQASDAAAEIERSSRPQEDTVEISQQARAVQQGAAQDADLFEGLINLSRARAQIMANLATARTADEVSRTALKIGKKA